MARMNVWCLVNGCKLKWIQWYQITTLLFWSAQICECCSGNIHTSQEFDLHRQSSIWMWSKQCVWSPCIFMLGCLAWHLPADNLWHSWCQSAVTSLIKGPQILNIFFRWQETLVLSRGLICGVYLFNFPQFAGYLGTNQCVSEFYVLGGGGCLYDRCGGQEWDMDSTATEARETALSEGGKKGKTGDM